MADVGFSVPRNDVVSGTYRTERLAIGANATIAEMLPGACVVFDTNDHDVKAAGALGDIIGFLGYGEAHSSYKPATRDTAYTALNDEVPVHHGADMIVRCPCASTSFVKGDKLACGASGVVKAGTIGTDHIIGEVLISTTTATTVWMRSFI